MTRFGFIFLSAILLIVPVAPTGAKETTNAAPDFKEVYNLIRKHLEGATDAELNRAAVEGLFAALHGKAALVSDEGQTEHTNAALVSKSSMLENDVAYIRVGRVDDGLATDFSGVIKRLGATNNVKGVVMDLRFASGQDYAAAAAVADLFLADAKPLLDWGNGVVQSEKKNDAIKLPVAVLVNRRTSGAAEALAAVLRERGIALILGGATAGNAMIMEEFALKNGQRLRVATSQVKLADGTALSGEGVKPDIQVSTSLSDERAYLDDPYARLAKTVSAVTTGVAATNQIGGSNPPSRRPRPTEADLVRARREGVDLDVESAFVRDTEPEKPVIRDPALARAVDLIKGLAVIRQSRP